MPSSWSRCSASSSSPSRTRSPALSWVTSSMMSSHSGVAYSGWLPTSRYSRAPLRRKTLLLRPQLTTLRKRYRATSSGLSRRCPLNVHVTPYSFSIPKMRRSTTPAYGAQALVHAGAAVLAEPAPRGGPLAHHRNVSVASPLSVEPPWVVHELAAQWFLPATTVAERLFDLHRVVDGWVTAGAFVLAPPLYLGPPDHPVFRALAEHVRARHPDDRPAPFCFWDDL